MKKILITEQQYSNLIGVNEETYTAYHGTNNLFDKFDFKRSPGNIVWFTDNINDIKSGMAGASGTKYIMKRNLEFKNPAGWEEYEKYGIGQLISMGYDGVILPDSNGNTFIAFSPKNIKKIRGANLVEQTKNGLKEEQIFKYGFPLFYHGATDKNLSGKNGIHVGTKMAATQALQAKIGIPAEGEWDGTREYGKTLLAGKKTLKDKNYTIGYDPIINLNATEDVPEEDYYPEQRKKRATYFSSDKRIPLDSKPVVFPVIIVGEMSNTYDTPISDKKANDIMYKNIENNKANSGFYYINKWEDEGSISAVVPSGKYLKIIDEKYNQNDFNNLYSNL